MFALTSQASGYNVGSSELAIKGPGHAFSDRAFGQTSTIQAQTQTSSSSSSSLVGEGSLTPTLPVDAPGIYSSNPSLVMGGVDSSVPGTTSLDPVIPSATIASVDDSNETPVFIVLESKPWDISKNNIPLYGDKRGHLGHERQLVPGDLAFVYKSRAPTPNELSIGGGSGGHVFSRKEVVLELAKLNEIIAEEHHYIHSKMAMEKSSWTFASIPLYGDGGVVITSGRKAIEIISKIYAMHHGVQQEEARKKIGDLSFYNMVKWMEHLLDGGVGEEEEEQQQGGGGDASDEEEEEWEEKSRQKGPLPREDPTKKSSIWPNSVEVYRLHCYFFPNVSDNLKNSLRRYRSNEHEASLMNEKFMDVTQKFEKCKSLFTQVGGGSWTSMWRNKKHGREFALLVSDLLQYALTEILAMNEQYVRYCTLPGLVNSVAFFGVLHNSGDGTTTGGPVSSSKMSPVNNYVVKGRVKAINRWGNDLPILTKLFILVKRERSEAPYQFIPWHTPNYPKQSLALTHYSSNKSAPKMLNDTPDDNDLLFMETGGMHVGRAHSIFVGTVEYGVAGNVNSDIRRLANGICDVTVEGDKIIKFSTRGLESKTSIGREKLSILVKN